MKQLDLEQICMKLKGLFATAFGGKNHGRYSMTYANFLKICNIKRLNEGTLYNIADVLFEEENLILIYLGDRLAVIEASTAYGWRAVPKSML